MRLRLAMSPMSRSATSTPSPSRSGGARWTPSGDTMAVQQPPRSALRMRSSGVMASIWASSSQPVALTTKQPASSAWWRIVTSIWSAKICPTIEPGNCAAWISSRCAMRL